MMHIQNNYTSFVIHCQRGDVMGYYPRIRDLREDKDL